MKKITELRILDNYRIWLRFNDGVAGEVDFSSKPRTGVFAFWNNYEDFRKARIGEYGELLWNDQVDFGADSLWLRTGGPVGFHHTWTRIHPNKTGFLTRIARISADWFQSTKLGFDS